MQNNLKNIIKNNLLENHYYLNSDNLNNNIFYLFLICAIIGTTIFILRVIGLFFIGLNNSHESENFDYTTNLNHEHEELPVKKITLHSISGFLMTFGWVGLFYSNQQPGISILETFLISTISGIIMLFVTGLIIRLTLSLESKGSVFNIKQTVGLTGSVYQEIPDGKTGKINLIVNGVSRELLAISINGKKIESFKLVKVISCIDQIVEVIEIKDNC